MDNARIAELHNGYWLGVAVVVQPTVPILWSGINASHAQVDDQNHDKTSSRRNNNNNNDDDDDDDDDVDTTSSHRNDYERHVYNIRRLKHKHKHKHNHNHNHNHQHNQHNHVNDIDVRD